MKVPDMSAFVLAGHGMANDDDGEIKWKSQHGLSVSVLRERISNALASTVYSMLFIEDPMNYTKVLIFYSGGVND